MTKYLFLGIVLLTFSCRQANDSVPETATSGTLRIAYDASYLPIVSQETAIFQYLYKNATVLDTVLPQEKAHEWFLKDSVKVLFSSRMLNVSELKYLKSKNVYPKTYELAQEGLVLLLNRQSKDTVISINALKGILKGVATKKVIVVDNGAGASIVSLVGLLGLEKDTLKNIFSADSTNGIVDYVAQNENAIGVVGGAWLSDTDNPKVKAILEKVTVAKVAATKSSQGYAPFQSEIADSLYPLKRTIYMISRESQMSLANGFASFLLGEKGQRVVLKAGLLPSRMPGREVVMSKKGVY